MATNLTKPTLTKAQAMKLCEEIREGIGVIGEKLHQLHKGTGWTVLGYLTWKDCVEQEFRHSAWWANNQLRIAEVRKALPPPPPQTPPQRGKEYVAPSRREAPQSDGTLSDRAVSELANVPEADRPAVLARASEGSNGKPPTAKAIREAAKPDYGKCPNCAGTKWDTDDQGYVDCAKCHHPYGEPAGDVDDNTKPPKREPTPADEAKAQVKIWADAVGRWLSQSPSIDEYRAVWPGPKGDAVVMAATKLYEALKNWRKEIK